MDEIRLIQPSDQDGGIADERKIRQAANRTNQGQSEFRNSSFCIQKSEDISGNCECLELPQLWNNVPPSLWSRLGITMVPGVLRKRAHSAQSVCTYSKYHRQQQLRSLFRRMPPKITKKQLSRNGKQKRSLMFWNEQWGNQRTKLTMRWTASLSYTKD